MATMTNHKQINIHWLEFLFQCTCSIIQNLLHTPTWSKITKVLIDAMHIKIMSVKFQSNTRSTLILFGNLLNIETMSQLWGDYFVISCSLVMVSENTHNQTREQWAHGCNFWSHGTATLLSTTLKYYWYTVK